MRVLVTGANGFLGSHVAEALAARGHALRLLLRRTSRVQYLRNVDYERIEGDMRDATSLQPAVRGVEAVVHVAGLTTARKETEYDAVNAKGTAALVQAARDAGVGRFVYVSSLAAQGPSPDGALTPPDLPRPLTAYGRSKLAGELAVLFEREKMDVAIVRLPVVYGPRDRALLPLFRLSKRRVMPLFGDGSNRLSWVHVLDAAQAIALVTSEETRSGSIYTIADGEPHSWLELADTLAGVLGRRPMMIRVPPLLYSVAASFAGLTSTLTRRPLPLSPEKIVEMREPHWVCGYERIAEDLGWHPTLDARAGLAQTVTWYREAGWL